MVAGQTIEVTAKVDWRAMVSLKYSVKSDVYWQLNCDSCRSLLEKLTLASVLLNLIVISVESSFGQMLKPAGEEMSIYLSQYCF